MKILLGTAAVLGTLVIGGAPAAAPAADAQHTQVKQPADTHGHGIVLVDDTMHSCGWRR